MPSYSSIVSYHHPKDKLEKRLFLYYDTKTMFFKIQEKSTECRARTGIITTDHGEITTPMFMPVGTKATVKSLRTQDLLNIGTEVILGNTYHLHLRPGEDLIDGFGGLHNFMQWQKPILTDSGGFQVFSLGAQKDTKEGGSTEKLVKIDDNGVTFRSHIDGAKKRFTPETAIQIQHKLGADIIMAFDECTPDKADKAYTKKAMDRTHRWAMRCLKEHKKNTAHHGYNQYLFGIIQGANHKTLRCESAKIISGMDFDGIAIGGESIGYNMEATKHILDWIAPIIPEHKPHYTMGVGFSPYDIFDVVERGVDMFDCVAPTRMARNGAFYVHPKTYTELKPHDKKESRKCWIDITNSQFKHDDRPLDPRMPHSPAHSYSRAYLHHLFKEQEILGKVLATQHNLFFLLDLMKNIQKAITEDTFKNLQETWEK